MIRKLILTAFFLFWYVLPALCAPVARYGDSPDTDYSVDPQGYFLSGAHPEALEQNPSWRPFERHREYQDDYSEY